MAYLYDLEYKGGTKVLLHANDGQRSKDTLVASAHIFLLAMQLVFMKSVKVSNKKMRKCKRKDACERT